MNVAQVKLQDCFSSERQHPQEKNRQDSGEQLLRQGWTRRTYTIRRCLRSALLMRNVTTFMVQTHVTGWSFKFTAPRQRRPRQDSDASWDVSKETLYSRRRVLPPVPKSVEAELIVPLVIHTAKQIL